MAAYAAVISLKNTIDHLLQSACISLLPPSPKILQLAKSELETLQKILGRRDRIHVSNSRKKVNALEGRIKDAVWELENLIESHLSDHILSSQFSIDLQHLHHELDFFINKLNDMKKEYIHELHNMPPVESGELVSSEFDSDSEMVGLSDIYEDVRIKTLRAPAWSQRIAIIGMPGIGKTRLAKKLYEDPEVSRSFDLRVWVTIGRKHEASEIARSILDLDPDFRESSKGKRWLIVLDDVWDFEVLEYLKTSFPYDGGLILITSRLSSQIHVDILFDYLCESVNIRLLNVDESKELLRRRVFGEGDFPSDIKDVAEKIARNCQGLPLMILEVAHRLSESKNLDPEYWDEVAKRRSSVFMDAYDEISEVLFPTYNCLLPQQAKVLLISVVAFPQEYEISLSNLVNLLNAERLPQIRNSISETLEDFGSSNQILYVLNFSTKHAWVIKTFGIYSWWWHLLNREAYKDKVNRVFYSDEVEEGIKGHHRLCLHTNFLFNFKNVFDTVKCDCANIARSLFCFGPYHQYSMPLDVGFKLLRVLDALKVRFYSFPVEIYEMVLLQYLALTCNGKLPSSISKLFNLQFLIIHPHMSIRSCGPPSYLPVEIWDMQELRHIEILGGNLPKPNSVASLEKLSKLLGVSPESCTSEVFEKIPNLVKLGIQIELAPHNDERNPLSCFHHISELDNLKSLKCSIVNPDMTPRLAPPPARAFPPTLRKLHLSGLGYPWEYMKVIGSLRNLEVLKLRCFAFQGPKWEAESGSFAHVKYLLIEDSDLVQWKPANGSFQALERVCLKHCYKLQEFQWVSLMKVIELVDCNPLVVASAKRFERRLRQDHFLLLVTAYFDNKELH